MKKMNSEIETDRTQVQVDRGNNIIPNSFSIKLKHVKLGLRYLVSNDSHLLFMALFGIILAHFPMFSIEEINQLSTQERFNHKTVILFSISLAFSTTLYFKSRPRKVYLVNFACYKPDPVEICSKKRVLQVCARTGIFTEESLAFEKKIVERSGLGQKTYFPKALMQVPLSKALLDARKESEAAIFGPIDELLERTGMKPRDIGILVVNSSLFNPVPSLLATIVNRYKLRENILSYNLGGMGCSAGLISIDLAKQLLQVHPRTYALVVSTENITYGSYLGNNRAMLLSNCLFRIGGAAVLLSNLSSDRHCSKYELVHTLRTHEGANNKSYKCVFQQEDEDGKIGVALSKELMTVAGEALKRNITTLGPLVLPLSEQVHFIATLVAKKVFKKKVKPYIPDFKLAFDHFCIHAGGRAVLDELQKSLQLSEWHMEPSRMTLYRFGNTSSSSLWYELAYSEAKGRMKKGDRIWQIGFGSGFKCNSAVWRALRRINPTMEKNPWMDEIDDFPVHVPKVEPLSVLN
ncbi:hypothetical protein REPUB_Repub20aG0091300 [Reevesia pubescens]